MIHTWHLTGNPWNSGVGGYWHGDISKLRNTGVLWAIVRIFFYKKVQKHNFWNFGNILNSEYGIPYVKNPKMTNIDEKLLSNKNLVRMQAFSIENPAEIGKTPPKNHKICQDLPKFVKFGNFLANFQQRNKKKHPMCPCETFKRWPKLILQYISGSCEEKKCGNCRKMQNCGYRFPLVKIGLCWKLTWFFSVSVTPLKIRMCINFVPEGRLQAPFWNFVQYPRNGRVSTSDFCLIDQEGLQ